MAHTLSVEKIPHLGDLGNVVPGGYAYYEKLVTPGADLSLPNAYLKWYDIRQPDVEITQAQIAESRAFIEAEVAADRLKIAGEIGFVLLHHCGSVLLLLVTTWRNTNEMWETVYVKDLREDGSYTPLAYETNHRGTYCVWELGPIWHERGAWVRFLASKRQETDKLAYINDRFSGLV